MIERTFEDLVLDLKQRRVVGDRPPIVLLGAGASVESGIGAMTDLFKFLNRANFDEFVTYIQPLTTAERYRYLADFLQTRQPAEVTPGYQALAALCAEAYFDIILTTNLDPLLDDALAAARLWRKDYLLLVNGVIRADRLRFLLTLHSPRVKIIKLHGDLFQRFMAWTPGEMDVFITDVAPQLEPILDGRDVLVVGHSLRDERIRTLVLDAGGSIWYTHPEKVPDFLSEHLLVRSVIGPQSSFEQLFTGLADALGVDRPGTGFRLGPEQTVQEMEPTGGAHTVDDLMASVVGLARKDLPAASTGFVLSEPRLIVADGFSGSTHLAQDEVVVISADNRRLRSRVLGRATGHPFAPVLIEVPEELKVPGLRLNAGSFEPNLPVHIGVAAGERVGISSGVIVHPDEQDYQVAPIGRVEYLVTIDTVTAEGSAGAPVLDSSFAVRGYIVAGGISRPPALMYPAHRWATALQTLSSDQ